MVKQVAFHTLGCRLNFSESGELARGFVKRGYEVVPFGTPADVTFLNTCTVTDGADSSCRHWIRRARRLSPEGKIVVAGCYAQMEAPRIAKMQGVDLILGTSEKFRVFDYLGEEEADLVHIDKSVDFYSALTGGDSRTRAFLKIQDGCNYVCSFCVIPQARGRSRGISVKEAKGRAREALAEGFREIILTGVNIGEYRGPRGERLVDLLEALAGLPKLERLRLSSVEPNTIDDELLALLGECPVFMPHFHIPLQSGDDTVLASMRRKYDVARYREIIGKVAASFPGAGIGADVICGYPGESEENFANTRRLLQELPITHFHVFPYSRRRGTTAARMEGQLQHGIKKERVRVLRALGERKLAAFARSRAGTCADVLFEGRKGKFWEGHTPQFLRVVVESEEDLGNSIVSVQLTDRLVEGKVRGEFAKIAPFGP